MTESRFHRDSFLWEKKKSYRRTAHAFEHCCSLDTNNRASDQMTMSACECVSVIFRMLLGNMVCRYQGKANRKDSPFFFFDILFFQLILSETRMSGHIWWIKRYIKCGTVHVTENPCAILIQLTEFSHWLGVILHSMQNEIWHEYCLVPFYQFLVNSK